MSNETMNYNYLICLHTKTEDKPFDDIIGSFNTIEEAEKYMNDNSQKIMKLVSPDDLTRKIGVSIMRIIRPE